jgi:GTP-binding protein EngB required for normal cell division
VNENATVFAVLGHPNEGKSSVVSTLAEDDSVKISPIPGETRVCREYPVVIDGRTVIRFVDTPGFQNPRRTLEWIEGYTGPDDRMISEFIRIHSDDDAFSDECELFAPLADGAGVIFVVDGSRPLRRNDAMEMEILRKTGLPRMIVINAKEKGITQHIEAWRNEARKHFNTIQFFDAHRASFAQRINLLESLKHIDPDWQPALDDTISAFKADWHQRLEETAAIIDELLQTVINHKVEGLCRDIDQIEATRQKLIETYQKQISGFEKQAHQRIKKRFKHNIFSYELPPQSILKTDLFDRKTWQILGLSRTQMALAGAGLGAGIGVQVDLALGGLTFGIFTAMGSLLGAGSAAAGTKKMAAARIKGLPLGGAKIEVGPIENDQLLYVLADRCLIYFSHVINWTHSRRDTPGSGAFAELDISTYLSAGWSEDNKKISRGFFKSLRKGDSAGISEASISFRKMLLTVLTELSV